MQLYDGAQISYHKNGSEIQPTYKRQEARTMIWYYENGNKMEEAPTVDGKKYGKVRIPQDGSKSSETPM